MPEQSIEVISAEKGSVKIVLELPERAAFELHDLYKRKDPKLFSYLEIVDFRFIEDRSASRFAVGWSFQT